MECAVLVVRKVQDRRDKGVNVNKLLGLSTMLVVATPNAGEADVTAVDVTRNPDGTYRFDVTVQHADEGWKHYANRWEVLTLDNRLLKTRTLHHPHVNEQPFTRSLSGVAVPEGQSRVKIRARDSKHGYSSQEFIVDIPGRG